MKISIIGGTGFVGSYLIDALVQAGHSLRLLVREGSENKLPTVSSVPLPYEVVNGDISQPAALAACVAGCDAVIYLIGILREDHTRGITYAETQLHGVERTIEAAKQAGVPQFLLMSANGVKAQGTPYQTTKYQAEQRVRDSGMAWTIFRPSVIFGEPRGKMEFCTQLQQQLIKPPIPAPLFFPGVQIGQAGEFCLAPVHVSDVAAAFVNSVNNPACYGKTFALCGPDAVSWKTIIQTLAHASGYRQKLAIPAPAEIIKFVANVFATQSWFPITRDQIVMLLEGNTCDNPLAWQVLGIQPKRFDLDNLAYLKH